jgi:transposase
MNLLRAFLCLMIRMEKENARKQTLEQLHERRKQVVRLHQKSHQDHADRRDDGLELSGGAGHAGPVCRRGWSAIRPSARGRARGDGRCLSAVQEEAIRRTIIDKRPEQLKMDFFLWSRAAVGQLIEQEYGIKLQVRSVGKYLARWGFTPQKPIRRAYEQSPAAVQAWLEGEYPGIAERARHEGQRFTGVTRRRWSIPTSAAEASRPQAKPRWR